MITCEVCGTVVSATTNHDSGTRRQKTCLADECRKEMGRRRQRRYLERGLRPSRRSQRIWVLDCGECGKPFTTRYPTQMACDDECRRKRTSRVSSESIMHRYHSDPEFRDLVISKSHNRHARKLGVDMITSPATLVAYLMDRDKGRCQIPDCQHTTRRIQATKGPWRPSVDHIVPLSLGGKHELANLQLAHYRCNLAKHNSGGGDQLLLVG